MTKTPAIAAWCVLAAWGVALGAPASGPVGLAPASGPTPLEVEKAYDDLKTDDWILQAAAMSRLVRWNHKDAPSAITVLLDNQNAKPWIRGRALVALAQLRGPAILAKVLDFAKHDTPELRAAAMDALAIIGSPQALTAVQTALADKTPLVRYQAVVAYAQLQRAKAFSTIAPLAAQDDVNMLRAVAKAMVYIDTPEAIAKLLGLLGHKDASVRLAAAQACAIAPRAGTVAALLAAMNRDPSGDVRAAAKGALGVFAPKLLTPPLLEVLKGPDAELYGSALDLLSRSPTDDACRGVAALLAKGEDRYKPAKPAMLRMLSRSAAPDDYQSVFILSLADQAPETRQAAATALGRCPKADVFTLLKPVLWDSVADVRNTALQVLQDSQQPPPTGIVDYLDDVFAKADADMQSRALTVLGERMAPAEMPRALKVLNRILGGSDESLRTKAAKALDSAAQDDESKRQVAAAQGYITKWMLLGALSDRPEAPLAIVYPPEQEIDFAKRYDTFMLSDGAEFKLSDAMCGGLERKSVLVRPPIEGEDRVGSVVATFSLALPQKPDLTLSFSHGLLDTDDSNASARISLEADGAKLVEVKDEKPDGWHDSSAPLSAYAGKKIALTLTVEGLTGARNNAAALSEPKVLSGTEVVADLLALVPKTPAQSILVSRAPGISWSFQSLAAVDGRMVLNDMFAESQNCVAYAVADLEADQARQVQFNVDADDFFALWINGLEVARQVKQGPARIPVQLKQGANRVLVKVGNQSSMWTLSVRLSDDKGAAASGISEITKAPAALGAPASMPGP